VNLVLISKCGPPNLHIVQRVLGEWPTAVLIRPSWDRSAGAASASTQLLRGPLATAAAATRRLWRATYARHVDRVVSRHLFGSTRPPAPPRAHEIRASLMNGPEGLALVRSLKPDLIILSGAPILGDALLRIPRYGVLNVHFGIAPQYRGSHTLFYALYREEYSQVGVTLHYVDAGVDTGPVVAQAFPHLDAWDTEATVQAKSARMAADLLLDFLRRSSSGRIEGRPQDQQGHLYRYRDRSVGQDAAYLFRRTVLRRRPDARQARRVKYF
jgi:methionyl-tRNA formyltransferase